MAYDWSGKSHPKYDTSTGFGNSANWRKTFKAAMGWDEAAKVVEESKNTPWGILGIAANSAIDEIKRAYRKLAQQWHPDKWESVKQTEPEKYAEAERMFKQINAAYVLLTEKR